ncbi:MAG: saccharopine dehydrogenase NADP-binding domain-containing protein [Bermanella sp.]
MNNKKILVLGGYGNFGKRIVEDLSSIKDLTIIIAGRNLKKAQDLANSLMGSAEAQLIALSMDINSETLDRQLCNLSPFLVIHTSGPFQGQNHRVPLACIQAGSHYIDLADDSSFVCGIEKLNLRAEENKLLVVSGASSVPGLSSAVLDHYKKEFTRIDSIDIAIAPGNKAERGEATVRGVLSYIGKPFPSFNKGIDTHSYGWMNIRRLNFGGIIGKRWLANVDVPDLSIYPTRYNVQDSVTFQAGLELPALHISMYIMAWLSKLNLFKSWHKLTKPIVLMSNLLSIFGTDKGAMRISIIGKDNEGKKTATWTLFADNGVGPYIPTISAIIIARKLIANEIKMVGATPCLGIYQLYEFVPYIKKFELTTQVTTNG